METYSFLRQLADSWGLVVMVLVFVAVCIWVFRPGGSKVQNEIARSILNDESRPGGSQENTARPMATDRKEAEDERPKS